ncbi:hypothetical protein GA707_14690 [Nostocoides sp. F2B08]|uniref:hypothetical protein n=1 Tax=Nostocoides sp. F2B08 TaxID=2653936 RepID=UPI001262C1D6|nr:hypothetical protein [Tetrasphaera sp. F2B08]KAB7743342.1 hypothetical protein GA707_14690 [Tetrasphaera sp. F2B08]
MAMAQMVPGVVLLPLQEADPAQQQGWWGALGQGIENFLTVERVRDTVIIAITAALYYWLSRHAKDRMILRPTRIAVAQDLWSYHRRGLQHPDLIPLANGLESPVREAARQEELVMRALALRRDLAAEARLLELAALDSDGLRAAADSFKASLHPPIAAYLKLSTLTAEKCTALRQALAAISHDNAEKFWVDNRMVLRRMRKSQAIGVTGLLLIVLLVILFGNPAIVAFGVLGAVVSRMIAFSRESTDEAHKFNWVILFLVPIVGGLSAYAGVLVIDAARTWGLLGETFDQVQFNAESANVPTLAAAFLFGFVERLLDNIVDKAAPDGLAAAAAQETETAAKEADKAAKEAEATAAADGAARCSAVTVEVRVKGDSNCEQADPEDPPDHPDCAGGSATAAAKTDESSSASAAKCRGGQEASPSSAAGSAESAPSKSEVLRELVDALPDVVRVLRTSVLVPDESTEPGGPPPPQEPPPPPTPQNDPAAPLFEKPPPGTTRSRLYAAGIRAGTFLAGVADALDEHRKPQP